MKDAMRSGAPGVAVPPHDTRKRQSRLPVYCSICTNRIWSEPMNIVEPDGVPEPRLSWTLCKACYQALVVEMSRSPLQSPLRLRIAMGLVAAERWPHAYSTRVREYVSDRRWIIFMAAAFIIAMLVHLMLIVMIAGIK
ncbi:hypothetical protein [Dictyobacter arantiisoli]|uniref:Uncharacterized protein n=1 Tax=Dictyobacter arantiisoli TaxID=2014874 RepID=A0A5A5TA66_9CHLR|nr:hypothetical protein [Dictyobacter arantiisoli]GCF08312.1 hypothetical protein KDI_18760 [Dictyobacter arantiisoli]